MKIAMLGPSYPFKGGIPEYTTNLFRSLKTQHNVLFCSFKRQYPMWLYPGKSDIDVSARYLHEPNAEPIFDSLNPFSWLNSAKRITAFEPNVLILPWWVFFLGPQFAVIIKMVRRRQANIKVIFVCHNVIAHENNWFARWLTRAVLSMGDGFLVHSETDRIQLTEELDNPKVELAELPTYELGEEALGNKSEARKRLAVDGPILLFFGFVRPYKGLEVLLKAMPQVLSEINCTLLVAGEFWYNSESYPALVRNLGLESNVRIENRYIPREEISDYFLASDLVLLPYLSATGSGIAKLAYSFGRPVIVSNVGSLPQSVEEGVNGYIVPPGEPDALAKVIINHFKSGKQQAMQRSSADHGKKFSWQSLTQKLEKLFV